MPFGLSHKFGDEASSAMSNSNTCQGPQTSALIHEVTLVAFSNMMLLNAVLLTYTVRVVAPAGAVPKIPDSLSSLATKSRFVSPSGAYESELHGAYGSTGQRYSPDISITQSKVFITGWTCDIFYLTDPQQHRGWLNYRHIRSADAL